MTFLRQGKGLGISLLKILSTNEAFTLAMDRERLKKGIRMRT